MNRRWEIGLLLWLVAGVCLMVAGPSIGAADLPGDWTLVEERTDPVYRRYFYRDADENILIDAHVQQKEVEWPFHLVSFFNQVRLNTLNQIEGYQPVLVRELAVDEKPVIRHDYLIPSPDERELRSVSVWMEREGLLTTLFFYLYESSYVRLSDMVEEAIDQILTEKSSLEELGRAPARPVPVEPVHDPEPEVEDILQFLAEFEQARVKGDYSALLNLYADPYTFIGESGRDQTTFRIGEWAVRLRDNLETNDYHRWDHDQPKVRFPEPGMALVVTDRIVRYTRDGQEYRFWDQAELTLTRERTGWKLITLRILEGY